jgi:hypothetical protein
MLPPTPPAFNYYLAFGSSIVAKNDLGSSIVAKNDLGSSIVAKNVLGSDPSRIVWGNDTADLKVVLGATDLSVAKSRRLTDCSGS